MNIGAKLKTIRLQKDLTLADVANATSLSVETIRNAEAGAGLNERTSYKLERFIARYRGAVLATEREQ